MVERTNFNDLFKHIVDDTKRTRNAIALICRSVLAVAVVLGVTLLLVITVCAAVVVVDVQYGSAVTTPLVGGVCGGAALVPGSVGIWRLQRYVRRRAGTTRRNE